MFTIKKTPNGYFIIAPNGERLYISNDKRFAPSPKEIREWKDKHSK